MWWWTKKKLHEVIEKGKNHKLNKKISSVEQSVSVGFLGDVEEVQKLISGGAEIDLADGSGRTPIYLATLFSNY